jgi:DNA-binding XRE family transcriptional regulator
MLMTILLPHYVRRHRLRTALTQREMATLLGCQSSSTVCQYEGRKREPDLRTALAYQVVFGLPVEALFTGIHREVEQDVKCRANRLSKQFAKDAPTLSHKRQALRSILAIDSVPTKDGEPNPTL